MAKRTAIRAPRMDDRPIFDVMLAIWGYPAVLVANKMRLFDLLAERALTIEEICAAKGMARRPAQALLSVCSSLGLMSLQGGRYSLTALSEDYLVSSSPTYYGWFFDAWFPIIPVWSPESLLKAVMTDSPQGPFGDPPARLPRGMRSRQRILLGLCTVQVSRPHSHGQNWLISQAIARCLT